MKKLILSLLVCASLFGSDFEDMKKSCDGGNAIGCYNLGVMYAKGQGIKQNNFKAIKLFKKACDGGIAAGCKNYALLKKELGL